MKDLVTTFLKEQGVWVALGIGVGAGIYEFMKTKSFGKSLTVLSAGFVIAFFCLYPEEVLAKFGEGMNWALSHIKVLMELRKRFDYFKSIVPFILYFLFVTGLRFGELIGLTIDELDFEKNRIYTYRRYNTLSHKFVPPKNKTSVRFVPISKEDMLLLSELLHLQENVNLELGIQNKDKLVFQHFGYKYDVPDIATVNKYLKSLLKGLEIYPLLTTKGARHTFGSYLWHCGIDLGVIAKVLGHKDISMLIEVYGHTLEEKVDEEFERIRLLKRNDKKSGANDGAKMVKSS